MPPAAVPEAGREERRRFGSPARRGVAPRNGWGKAVGAFQPGIIAARLTMLLLLLLACGPVAAAPLCPAGGGGGGGESEVVRLAGVDAAGDPVLADGRVLRLVGIAPRQDDEEDARFRVALEAWRGRALRLLVLGPPDRWSRLPARLLADAPAEGGGAAGEEVGAALVAAGAARRLAEPGSSPCPEPQRSAGEPAALRAGQGRAAAAAPGDAVDGHDIAALKVQAGRILTLTGRIASVGERSQRTYLNLSRRRGEAASIVMSRRLWREMQQAGWTAARLDGRAVRAEGILSGRDGLLLEITAVSALNVID